MIGTNKPDAAETVTAIMEDASAGRVGWPTEGQDALAVLVRARQPHVVSYDDWRRLDAIETARGRAAGRPRVKFTRVDEMLAALGR